MTGPIRFCGNVTGVMTTIETNGVTLGIEELGDAARIMEERRASDDIKEAAAAHPQLCAFEAALFREVLGAHVTRRQTIASGAQACVCHVRARQETTKPSPDHPRST